MNTKYPKAESFLQIIDSKKVIDINKLLSEIAIIALIRSIRKSSVYLSPESKTKLDKLMKSAANFDFNAAIELFSREQKIQKLKEISVGITNEINEDYIKTQYKALNNVEKKKALDKFPELANLIS